LLFATGEFRRAVLQSVLQSHAAQQFARATLGLGDIEPCDAGGEGDIFQRVKFREEVVGLKDVADVREAELREFTIGQRGKALAAELDFAVVGAIQSAEQVQQRALARAGRAAQRDELAGFHGEVHAAQDFHEAGADAVGFAQAGGAEEGGRHEEEQD
jgi:hypothetical protein